MFLADKHFGGVAVERIDEMALADFVRTLRRLPAIQRMGVSEQTFYR